MNVLLYLVEHYPESLGPPWTETQGDSDNQRPEANINSPLPAFSQCLSSVSHSEDGTKLQSAHNHMISTHFAIRMKMLDA